MKLFGFHLPGTRDKDAEIRALQAQVDELQKALAQKDADLQAAQLQVTALQKPTLAPQPVSVQNLSPKLTIELVPQTCWLSNVRNHVPKPQWDRIRKSVYQKAGYRCEVCGGKGAKHPVECHEIFAFDDQTRVQTLVRMVALCPACHKVKHYGLAQVHGYEAQAFGQLCKVNGWTPQVAERYVNQQFSTWRERSQHEWSVDLDLLRVDYGLSVQEERADKRVQRADAFYQENWMNAAGKARETST